MISADYKHQEVRSEMGREYNSTVSSSSCPFPLARRRDRGSGEENTQCQPGVEIRIQQQGKTCDGVFVSYGVLTLIKYIITAS